jgi:hypothetical protein
MMTAQDDGAYLKMSVTWKPIDLDWEWWNHFLANKVVPALTSPQENPACSYCAMRRGMEVKNV